MNGTPFTADDDHYIISTYGTHTAKQQAAALGRSYSVINKRRAILRKYGKVQNSERAYGRPWTAEERALITSLLQEGHRLKTIARRVNRGVHALYTFMERNEESNIVAIRSQEGARVRSARQVGILFGVTDMTVAKWIRWGLLKAKRDGSASKRRTKRKPRYLITDDALLAFIDCRETWPAWSVHAITDADWRDYAAAARKTADGEWLSTKQVAHHYCYDVETVAGWRRDGIMDAVRSIQIGNTRYFWSADLDLFVPPSERTATKPPRDPRAWHGRNGT